MTQSQPCLLASLRSSARLSEMNQDCEPGQAEQEGTLRPTRTVRPKLIGDQIVVIVRHFMHGLPRS